MGPDRRCEDHLGNPTAAGGGREDSPFGLPARAGARVERWALEACGLVRQGVTKASRQGWGIGYHARFAAVACPGRLEIARGGGARRQHWLGGLRLIARTAGRRATLKPGADGPRGSGPFRMNEKISTWAF